MKKNIPHIMPHKGPDTVMTVSIQEQVARRNDAAQADIRPTGGRSITRSSGEKAGMKQMGIRVTHPSGKGYLAREKHMAAAAVKSWLALGLPKAETEFRFHPERQWRFDFAFQCDVGSGETPQLAGNPIGDSIGDSCNSSLRIAVEVQGAIFGTGRKCPACGQRRAGRHTSGAALLDEYEKLNAAAALGWRVLFVTPERLMGRELAEMLRELLGLKR